MALLGVAAPVGAMIAFTIGGMLNAAIGWRLTFVALGAPGLGCVAHLFATSAKLAWSAPFLIRVHNLNTGEAGAWLGVTTGVGGIAGMLGGAATQRVARTDPAWMLRAPALTCALALPFEVLFLTLPAASAPMMNLGASFFGASMMGPVLAVTQALAKVRMRALAAAVVALVVNVIGAGLGPFPVGVSSDLLAPALGPSAIRYGLLVPTVIALLGAAFGCSQGARHLTPELERVRE